jgi:hypothetical protein
LQKFATATVRALAKISLKKIPENQNAILLGIVRILGSLTNVSGG